MSMRKSGRPLRSGRTSSTCSARQDEPGALGRRERRCPTSRGGRRCSRARALAAEASASERAASAERLATKRPAPARGEVGDASSPVSPAPMSRTWRSRSSPNTCSASAAAAEETEAGSRRSRSRCARACRSKRLPNRRSSSGPGAAPVVRGAHLAEHLAFAEDDRVEPGGDAEEVARGIVIVRGGRAQGRARLAGELAREDRRLLGCVGLVRRGRARCGCTSRGRRPRRRTGKRAGERPGASVERQALAQLDGGDVMREADKTQGHVAKWLTRECEPRDGHEREAAETQVRSAAAGQPRDEER